MKKKTIGVVALLLILGFGVFVASSCGGGDKTTKTEAAKSKPEAASEEGTEEPIVIGVAGPFTGSAAAFGEQIRMGAELAQAEINAKGGINGRKVEFLFEDDQGRDVQANVVATKLAYNPKVVAVIGHFNSIASLAGKEVYRQAGIVEFSPGSTNVDVCRGSEWTFRNLYHDDYQGESLARYIGEVLGLKRVAIFYDNDDYGTGLKNAFRRTAEAIGLEIVGEESYTREQTLDFSAAIDKFDARDPDIIFISGLYNEAASIAKQTREKGIDTPFIGGDGLFSPALIEIGGEAVEGMLVTTPFIVHPDVGGPKAQAFREAFVKMHGRDPDTWAALTYDAANQLFQVIAEVGTDRRAIRDKLASMNSPETGYDGVTGLTYFDENGDTLKPAYVAVVRDGEFVPAERQLPRP